MARYFKIQEQLIKAVAGCQVEEIDVPVAGAMALPASSRPRELVSGEMRIPGLTDGSATRAQWAASGALPQGPSPSCAPQVEQIWKEIVPLLDELKEKVPTPMQPLMAGLIDRAKMQQRVIAEQATTGLLPLSVVVQASSLEWRNVAAALEAALAAAQDSAGTENKVRITELREQWADFRRRMLDLVGTQ